MVLLENISGKLRNSSNKKKALWLLALEIFIISVLFAGVILLIYLL
jgi:hypothetical protein